MKKILIKEIFDVKTDSTKSSKEEIVLDWLLEMRNYVLVNKIADFGDIIPSKKDISKILNISTGTIQNALRYAEDLGFFTSRQCIGTQISNPNDKLSALKMYSKKDKALLEIKKFLLSEGYKKNEIIPNIIEFAATLKTSQNTVRLALKTLIEEGVLRKEVFEKKQVLILNSEINLTEKEKNTSSVIKNKNLSKILKDDIKKYLMQNHKTGDKIPTMQELAKMFNVSIRTIDSAMKDLNKDKIILSRRGKYGSVFLGNLSKDIKSEKSLFMSKPMQKGERQKNYNYKWETAFNNIKKYILKNHEAGDKIPSVQEFANRLNVSTTTIKKAVQELVHQGVLYTQRGKYGGLFIVEMPQKEDSYQWLAINPSYFEN